MSGCVNFYVLCLYYIVNFYDCQQKCVIFFYFYISHKKEALTMSSFYNNYVELCAKKKKSLSAVAEEIGLSRTSPNGWKKGKQPSHVNI